MDFDLNPNAMSAQSHLESLPTLREGDYLLGKYPMRVTHSYRMTAFENNAEIMRRWRPAKSENSKLGDRHGSQIVELQIAIEGELVWKRVAWLTGQRVNAGAFLGYSNENTKKIENAIKQLLKDNESELAYPVKDEATSEVSLDLP